MQHMRLKQFSETVLISMITMLAVVAENIAFAEPTVITLTQVPCQFLEIESKDHGFTSSLSDECEKINARTSHQRNKETSILRLKPGEYIFRVANKNVPYELGFYLRTASLIDRLSLPCVSGGGLITGRTQDYPITLVAGEYSFSCPLNPTPDYHLTVSN